MEIKEITAEEFNSILATREPLGAFWTIDGDLYVGLDNTTGDAWTQDFTDKETCLAWLRREVG